MSVTAVQLTRPMSAEYANVTDRTTDRQLTWKTALCTVLLIDQLIIHFHSPSNNNKNDNSDNKISSVYMN